jgi:hypothetical protein
MRWRQPAVVWPMQLDQLGTVVLPLSSMSIYGSYSDAPVSESLGE